MGIYVREESIAGNDAWWLRWVHLAAQQLILFQCTKGNRHYPSSFSLKLLKISANHGYIPSKAQLGQYLFELGVAKADKRNGLEYLRQAAKADESNAQFVIGRAFFYGCDVVEQDNQLAAHWLALASDSGLSEAKQLLEIIQQNEAKMRDQASAVDVVDTAQPTIKKNAIPA